MLKRVPSGLTDLLLTQVLIVKLQLSQILSIFANELTRPIAIQQQFLCNLILATILKILTFITRFYCIIKSVRLLEHRGLVQIVEGSIVNALSGTSLLILRLVPVLTERSIC